ncbi:hypothetical protein [Oceanobacter antarcticus]|mgnify:CR=1 FL=1|uniref:YcxB-like protein n=1 Tax=Oceanobacter antarcticus TaxID=3133425 RepID=A0ABW8NPB0_9GAMM
MTVPEFEVQSIRYSFSDCLFEWGLCAFFSVLTILSLVGIFPLAGASFGLLALLAAGLIAVKVSMTPEVIRVVNGDLHYCQGKSKQFNFKSHDIQSVSFEHNLETFHNKLLVFNFKDGTEYSVPYKYLSDTQLDKVVEYYRDRKAL